MCVYMSRGSISRGAGSPALYQRPSVIVPRRTAPPPTPGTPRCFLTGPGRGTPSQARSQRVRRGSRVTSTTTHTAAGKLREDPTEWRGAGTTGVVSALWLTVLLGFFHRDGILWGCECVRGRFIVCVSSVFSPDGLVAYGLSISVCVRLLRSLLSFSFRLSL